MPITVEEHINAPRERVWGLISNPDAWTDMISGIISVDIIERPSGGIVGLKWTEKRMMFGKEATETMEISSAQPQHYYETTALNHGMLYTTRMSLDDADNGVLIRMVFTAKPTTLGARIMTPIAMLFNGAVRKALQQDLADIRQTAESQERVDGTPTD